MHRPKRKIDQALCSTLTLPPCCINTGHVTVVILVTAFYITGSLKRALCLILYSEESRLTVTHHWFGHGMEAGKCSFCFLSNSAFLAITSVTWPMAVTVLCINTYFKNQFTLLCTLTHFCIKAVLLLELALMHGAAHLLLGNSVL